MEKINGLWNGSVTKTAEQSPPAYGCPPPLRVVVGDSLMVQEFTIETNQKLDQLLSRLQDGLSKKGVSVQKEATGVRADVIAMPILGLDKRRFSRDNPIGINPFIHLDNFIVSIVVSGDLAQVRIHYQQYMPFFSLSWMCLVLFGGWIANYKEFHGIVLPLIILFVFLIVCYLFFNFAIIGRVLIRMELKKMLQQCDTPNLRSPSAHGFGGR